MTQQIEFSIESYVLFYWMDLHAPLHLVGKLVAQGGSNMNGTDFFDEHKTPSNKLLTLEGEVPSLSGRKYWLAWNNALLSDFLLKNESSYKKFFRDSKNSLGKHVS